MIDLALDDKIFITNKFDAAIQELDILFGTINTELIGYPKYGCNFEYFLWELTPNTDEIKKYISDKIVTTYFLSQLNYNIDVQYYEDTVDPVYAITLDLYTDDQKIRRTYTLKK